MSSVKRDAASPVSTVRERLLVLRDVFATPVIKRLTIQQLADTLRLEAETIKGWIKRDSISKQGEDAIIRLAQTTAARGVTYEWLRKGDGPKPRRSTDIQRSVPGREGRGDEGTAVADNSATMLAKRITDIITDALERQEINALNQAALISTMLHDMANFLQSKGVPKEALVQMRQFAQELVDGKYG